ncbi:MAG: hypothetical protein NC131_22240, partial [Roseburia sp.]|nr:hypothetical protein [Roseburia sp.]
MALTQADKNEMLNAIKAESQSVDELATVASLDGVNSLPAIRGTEVVNVPVSLLRKPAEDAAKTANAAAAAANKAAQDADAAMEDVNQAAHDADTAAGIATEAAENANQAAANAATVISQYEAVAIAARNGATARFYAILENATVQAASTIEEGGTVYYARNLKAFIYSTLGGAVIVQPRIVGGGTVQPQTGYFNNWPGADMYMNSMRTAVLKDKFFLCGATAYMWSDEKEDLVEVSGSGSGSGFYNLTEEQPLTTGYYTLETAVAALAEADIDDERKRGMIITFEESPGKWADYRFIGTTLSTFLTAGAWEEFGAKNVVKKITVNGEAKTPDADGNVSLTIDKVETDSSLDPDSDRPIQNGVVATKISELEAGTLFSADTEENDDGSTTVRLNSKTSNIV